MVDRTPEEAKNRAEQESARTSAQMKKHLEDLRKSFGEVGGVGGELQIGTDANGDFVLFENVYGKDGKLIEKKEVFFYVQPDGITYSKLYGAGFVKKVKQDYKGRLEDLRKQLYDKNFLTETDFVTKNETEFNNAIVKAARNYTLGEVQKYTIDGKTKFSPFTQWITGLGSRVGEENLPVRDINLMDRDVIEALVRDVYSKTTDMAIDDAFLKQETDRYMKQIKEGTLTTVTKSGGEVVRKTTKPFTQAQVEAELPERIKEQRPGATNYKTNFDFLAFISSLGAEVV